MKLFQALVLAGAIFALLLVILRGRLTAARVAASTVAAAAVGLLSLAFTPSESHARWSAGASLALQEIVLAEDDPHAYGRGLIAAPKLLPLPAVTGELVAKASRQDVLTTAWQGEVLAISVQRRDGSAGAVLCGVQEVRGVRVEYLQAAPVSPCPGR